LTRDVEEALPGDVIFYLNDVNPKWPYHTMVHLDGGWVIYHTGPDGNNPGIVKKLRLSDLAKHPNKRWHPSKDNPYFLGFYRWAILD
jgi:uncharacterized protein YfaT (DUF1175 family)